MGPNVVRILLVLIVAAAALWLFKSHIIKNDGTVNVAQTAGYFEQNAAAGASAGTFTNAQGQNPQISDVARNDPLYKNNTQVMPMPMNSNMSASANMGNFTSTTGNFQQMDCFPKDQLSPADLIPREDANNVWSQSNPQVQGSLNGVNFLDSGYHAGLNTVGQSLKNPNLQLRSDPPIPQRSVGPWMQSTIEPDTNRRQFDIGGF